MSTAGKHRANEAGARERIVQAARKLIAERGLEATSTKAIAAEAGVPSGLVFYYFETKDALIEAMFDENPTVVERAIDRARNRPLEGVLKAIYDDFVTHRYQMQIVVAAAASSHPVARKLITQRRSALAALAELFRSQSAGGTTVEPEVLAEVVLASMITAIIIDKPRNVSSYIQGLASVVRCGLARPA